MKPSLYFSAFELLHDVPEFCDVCGMYPPILNYQFSSYGPNGEFKENKGFCCSSCSGKLLELLQLNEFQQWGDGPKRKISNLPLVLKCPICAGRLDSPEIGTELIRKASGEDRCQLSGSLVFQFAPIT